MFNFVLFSTLISPIFTELGERYWACNSSAMSVWYTHCDGAQHPVSLTINPCTSLMDGKGNLHISYIPRVDIKQLYFNLYLSVKSMELPKRKEVVCRGSDDDYSFCRALKGETVNTTVSFSYKGVAFPKGHYGCVAEAITGEDEQMLFCLNITILHHHNYS
ncbi:lymphocyte antigen 96 [Suncus etruscus]|uniref:lymphocyte antigen 96 n=1 Tax=Suncus etruscus TaxID=109475 RepID=UPI002110CF74|nr:lymphocyte antigen 96 [Suncus etruscus]